jgi:hypothetical protein
MTVKTYEGHVEQGQIRFKDDPTLPEGAVVYVVVPEKRVSAIDPTPKQIALMIRESLDQYAAGEFFEIESAEDLERLINEMKLM